MSSSSVVRGGDERLLDAAGGGPPTVRQEVGPGGALKVRSDEPHLVSLGGGRLSTAVTLHPIGEGCLWLGSGEGIDIPVKGTGVEALHCRLENVAGVVTLHPNAPATSIDGLQVLAPTRLTQGCMICIGRSNYFRFNHPAEAQLMRSFLPNARISGVPLNFMPDSEYQEYYQQLRVDQKPPVVPRNGGIGGKWRGDGWEEEAKSSGASKPSICANNPLSQKLFPPGTATTSSPASDVLWRGCATPPASNPHGSLTTPPPAPALNLQQQQRRTLSAGCDLSLVGSDGHLRGSSEPPLTCRSATASPLPPLLRSSLNCSLEELNARKEDLEKKRKMVQNERLREQETQRREQVRLDEILNMCAEYERQVQWEKEQVPEQRRMAAWDAGGGSQGSGGTVPWQQRVSIGSGGATSRTGSSSGWEGSRPTPSPSPGSSTTSANSGSSSSSCSSSASSPPGQQMAPLPNSPVISSVHQNRIKTNGSLPRDKRLHSPTSGRACSPVMQRSNAGAASPPIQKTSPENEYPSVFNFDASAAAALPSSSPPSSYPHSSNSLPRHFGSCPREVVLPENIRTNGVVHKCHAVASPPNSPTSPSSPTYPTYPQSPRTRIRTNAASKISRSCCEVESQSTEDETNRSIGTRVALVGRPFGGTLPRSCVPSSLEYGGRSEMSPPANGFSNSSECDGIHGAHLKSGEEEAEELKRERKKLVVALAAIKRKMNDIERQREEALRELEMEQALLEGELSAVTERVREEESKVEQLTEELSQFGLSAADEREHTMQHVSDCQRRIEEAQALVNGLENELSSVKDAEKAEKLREQLKHHQESLEAERKAYEDMEFHQLEREASWEAGREEMSREASEIAARARSRRHRMVHLERAREEAAAAAEEEGAKLKGQQEMLIGRLEQGRQRLRIVEKRLSELSRQGVSIASWECSPDGSSDADESPPLSSTETSNPPRSIRCAEPIMPLSGLEFLNGQSGQGNVQRKQSQDDLDRISRVTSGAPIDVSSGGSLGRRTIESLRTIERNRQIHLVQQGSQVIEEERRRVEELKRRAQDEVRAKWEEERLRHAQPTTETAMPSTSSHNGVQVGGGSPRDNRVINCQSLNSVGSEEDSSIAGSDVPTESASSEDGKNRANHIAGTKSSAPSMAAPEQRNNAGGSVMVRPKEQDAGPERSRRESGGMGGEAVQQQLSINTEDGAMRRPQSDGCDYEDRLTPSGGDEVRMRNRTASSASTSRLMVQQQRPLTRYLPIRGEQLDLRAHMEWAGHQPDLCPHIELSATVCRGFLLKAPASLSAAVVRRSSSSHSRGVLSGLRGGSWSRRWFVFDRMARCFSYYTDSSEKKSRSAVDFEAIEDVYVDHLNSVKSPSPRLTFCVKTRERAFHLVAPSAETMRIWVDVIFTGAEGYTGFEYVS